MSTMFGPYDNGRNLSANLDTLEDRVLFLDRWCRRDGITDPKEAAKILDRSLSLILLGDEEKQQIMVAWCLLRATEQLPSDPNKELIMLDSSMLVGYEQ